MVLPGWIGFTAGTVRRAVGVGACFLVLCGIWLPAEAASIEPPGARPDYRGDSEPAEALHGSGGGMLGAGVGVHGARVRRRWPGRLGFGTFEAWCQARVSEGGLLCGLVGSGGGRVEPGVWAGAGGVPASGGLQYKGVAQRGGLWCDALAEAGVREFEAARSRVPPSLGAVVRYFEEALGEAPVHEESGRFRFERWEGFPWGASWRRCLVSGGGSASVCLEWWANDDFGVSELREFFEAPFFELSESMVFHQWLGEGGWHWGVLRGARLAMGVLARGDYVYVRIRWWQPPV